MTIFIIGKYSMRSDGLFHLEETFTTDSPNWEVVNGEIIYGSVELAKTKVKMSKTEALADNCHCYYKILN